MKKTDLVLTLLVAMLLTSCNNTSNSSSNNDNSSSSSSASQIVLGFDPKLEYKGDLDVFMYIYGQDGVWNDAGNANAWKYDAIIDQSQALFFAAAREFCKIYPDIKINVISGNGDAGTTYNDNFRTYTEVNGHVPHVFHHVDTTPELLESGFVADLSQYKDRFETYGIINPELMKYFNYGGFQAAVPYGCFPTGVYLYTKDLQKEFFYDVPSVDEWTVDVLDEIVTLKEIDTTKITSGVMDLSSEWINYITPTIYKQYIENGTIDLNTNTVKELVAMEDKWISGGYSWFKGDGSRAEQNSAYVQPWNKVQSFAKGNSRVMINRHYSMGDLAQYAYQFGTEEYIDFYPYPALTAGGDLTIGADFGALNVGNQCPIDASGKETCDEKARQAQEAAAYFAMFMVADTRSIKAQSEIEWSMPNASDESIREKRVGAIKGFPVVKKDVALSFLDNESEFDTQLEYFFNNYPMYENKTGFSKVLDMYKNNEFIVCSSKAYPFFIPSGVTGTKNIFSDWDNRYLGDGTIMCGDSAYNSYISSKLVDWTAEFNAYSETSYELLDECMRSYYVLPEDFDVREKIV